MRFSERQGIIKPQDILQLDEISPELKNSLWSVFYVGIIQRDRFISGSYNNPGDIHSYARRMWFLFFKQPTDRVPSIPTDIIEVIRSYFYAAHWYEIYDFLEYVINEEFGDEIIPLLNDVLERELSGYRIVGKKLVPVTDAAEVKTLSDVVNNHNSASVREHISTALKHLSNKPNPDTRNAIKEAISAVESIAREIAGTDTNSLGKALTKLEKSSKITKFQKQSFEKLYAYTNGANGIRHAIMEESSVSLAEAKYFIIVCSAFANYLQSIR